MLSQVPLTDVARFLRVTLHVLPHVGGVDERLGADRTHEKFLTGVAAHVHDGIVLLGKALQTDFAVVELIAGVALQVSLEVVLACKALATLVARVRSLASVRAQVFRQAVHMDASIAAVLANVLVRHQLLCQYLFLICNY